MNKGDYLINCKELVEKLGVDRDRFNAMYDDFITMHVGYCMCKYDLTAEQLIDDLETVISSGEQLDKEDLITYLFGEKDAE